MRKRKYDLKDLKVQSFVTGIDNEENKVKGGNTYQCSASGECCTPFSEHPDCTKKAEDCAWNE